jgi:maleylpyruvate isomerase
MTSPLAALPALRSSTAALLRGLADEQWSDADVQAPSLLPGWTRGHVLTHLARSADAVSRTLSGALRDEFVPLYPDGAAGRNADIEAGAGRPLAEQLLDVQQSADRLDRLFGAVADADDWHLQCDVRTAGEWLLGRWREVEIHRVDLGGSYRASDWPAAFVRYLLPTLLSELDHRLPDGTAVRLEIAADDSVTTELGGSVWTCGAGEQVSVTAPDWAVLAWLLGRLDAAGGALAGAPTLSRWL